MERLTNPGTKEAKSNVTIRQVLDKLVEYEDLEDRLNGISVQQVVDGFVKTIENQTCEGYEHGRILTNAEANQWNEYRQLDEQGLLLRLPCKFGSEVWKIERQFWIDCKGCKDCMYFGNDGFGDYCDYDEDIHPACTKIVPKRFNIRMLDDFGKDVFLMQSEAEQKLKEMKGLIR